MKRVIILIVISLVVMQLPVSAYGAGACGENAVWEFDASTGTLTIHGQGELETGEESPWMDFKKQIRHIVIEEGITSIGYGTFSFFPGLESVALPESLKVIQGSSFRGCSKLTDINLENVDRIDAMAFMDCGLTELVIPLGVTEISHGAFSGCCQLKKIVWHDGVTKIGDYAFKMCSDLIAVHLPNQVRTVGNCAFDDCDMLSDLKLNEGLQSIGDCAFQECDRLELVDFPDTLIEIGNFAFAWCEKLREVRFGAGFSELGDLAFWLDPNLTTFKLSEKNTNFALDGVVLYNADKTELILMPEGFSEAYVIPDGTTSIASKACYFSRVTAVTIPGSVTVIGDEAFDSCGNLKMLVIEEGVEVIGNGAFRDTAITEVTIPKSVTLIGGSAFSKCSELTKVVFKGSQPKNEDGCFTDVTGTLYYPGDISGWDEIHGYTSGKFEWIAYCSGVHIPAEETVKAPTCTEDGLRGETKCSLCNEVIRAQQTMPAIGHQFGAWVEDVPPTTENKGTAKRTCSDCGAVEWKALEQLPKEPEQTLPPELPAPRESNAPDVPNGADKLDVPDVPNGADKLDVPDVPNGADELDAPDVPDEPSQPETPDPTEPEGTNAVTEVKSGENSDSSDTKWIVPAVVAAVFLALGVGVVCFLFRRKR